MVKKKDIKYGNASLLRENRVSLPYRRVTGCFRTRRRIKDKNETESGKWEEREENLMWSSRLTLNGFIRRVLKIGFNINSMPRQNENVIPFHLLKEQSILGRLACS